MQNLSFYGTRTTGLAQKPLSHPASVYCQSYQQFSLDKSSGSDMTAALSADVHQYLDRARAVYTTLVRPSARSELSRVNILCNLRVYIKFY